MLNKLLSISCVLVSFLTCSLAFADAECVSAGLNSACGYDCVVSGLNVACARTPAGACIAVGLEVYCWDPPYPTNRKAECASAGLNYDCGYDCRVAGLNVRCSYNPYGACTVNGLNIYCSE